MANKKNEYKVLKGVEFPKGTPHKEGDIIKLTDKEAESFVEGLIKKNEAPATPGGGSAGPATPGKTESSTAPADTKKKDSNTVEVDKDVLKKVLDTIEKQKIDIEDLKASADIGRLSRIQQARESGKLVKTAKLSVYDKKIVVGWIKESDDVWFDEQGRLNEDQKICLFLENDDKEVNEGKPIKSKPMSYREFSRVVTKIEGEVIKESKDSDGQTFFTVQLDDGREFELPIQFIN